MGVQGSKEEHQGGELMAEVKKSKKVFRVIGRVFTVFISTIVMIFAALC